MHNLLKRQLNKYFGDSLQVPTEWQKFVEAVNDAYMQSDVDRGMFERSLDISSQELLHTNSEMRSLISLLAATIESTADGILVVNREGKIVSFNHKFIEMWHIPQQILNSRDSDQALSFVLDQLEDPEGFLKKVRELYANPEAESNEEIIFKDGRVFERYSQPQRIGQTIVGRVWSFRDTTGRKLAEEELKRSYEFQKRVMENATNAIYALDLEGKFTLINQRASQITGYEINELIGHPFSILFPPQALSKVNEIFIQIITQGITVSQFEIELIRKDGKTVVITFSAGPLLQEGKIIGAVGTAEDITERKKMEEEIKKRIKDLEDFYDMAVSREIRMKELKDKMKGLKEELEKYKSHSQTY
ncbi:MAG: PAS domain S-box protein [Thermodesulfovibrionales bacterium]|nr:PAS domain S-box protein [Thermodesulfovibrionales bacterium]